MIQINLLPDEYRKRSGTPIARFVATLVGVVAVLGACGMYGYTHFIELKRATDLRDSRAAETETKERLGDRSLALQREIDAYTKRRKAIQTISRSRTLWSKKLDQFFDIVTGHGTDEEGRGVGGEHQCAHPSRKCRPPGSARQAGPSVWRTLRVFGLPSHGRSI